jgi:hypothetical protein
LVALNKVPLILGLLKYHISLVNSTSFIKNSHNLIKKIYSIYFQYSFWINFKKRFTRKLGTVISNLTKSAFFLNYSNILSGLKKQSYINIKTLKSFFEVNYFQNNTLIPFNFHSKTYNTLVFFFITLLTTFYIPTQNEFKLYYAFI